MCIYIYIYNSYLSIYNISFDLSFCLSIDVMLYHRYIRWACSVGTSCTPCFGQLPRLGRLLHNLKTSTSGSMSTITYNSELNMISSIIIHYLLLVTIRVVVSIILFITLHY